MIPITDEMVEAVARAICEREGENPDAILPTNRRGHGGVSDDCARPMWVHYCNAARAALDAAIPLIGEECAKIVEDAMDKDSTSDLSEKFTDEFNGGYPRQGIAERLHRARLVISAAIRVATNPNSVVR